MSFKRTAPAFQRRKNQQILSSYGRETGRRPQVDVLRGGFGVPTPLRLRIVGRKSSAAAAPGWSEIEAIFVESVKSEYDEDVESVEWA